MREPAAFSPLPGVHRNFMPVGGDVVLTVDGELHEVVCDTVLRFSGYAVNLMSPSTSLRLRASTIEQSAAFTAVAPSARSLAAAHVTDPAAQSALPLAAVVLVGTQTGAHALGAQRFDLSVPAPGTTGAPPFAAAVVELT